MNDENDLNLGVVGSDEQLMDESSAFGSAPAESGDIDGMMAAIGLQGDDEGIHEAGEYSAPILEDDTNEAA